MSQPLSPEQQALHARIEEARQKITALEDRRRDLANELESMAAQRQQYQLLDQICESLEKLDQMGAASLFWGEQQPGEEVIAHVARARSTAAAFVQKVAALEQEREAALKRIQEEEWNIADLTEEIANLRAREEARQNEFVVYREIGAGAYRAMVLPWQGDPEDEKRLLKAVIISLLIVFSFAFLTRIWKFPPPEERPVVEIPKNLVKLVQKEKPKPPEPPKQEEKKEEEKPKDTAKATPQEKEQARAKAVKSGVLAFKSGFADLMQDSVSLKLGADARLTTSGQTAVGNAQRNLVTAQAAAGSGGISTASLSRNVGGSGKQVTGVAFTRVESAVAGMQQESDRPLSDGPGPSRTDEEIQIVFDKYKATLYRLYQKELRNDPSLRGKMVLKITIEPNGSVSACMVQTSDLASAALKNEIVERVKKFNFGGKEGVPRITILYPIDFLPAS